MRHECYFCHIKTVENLLDKFQPEEGIAEKLVQLTNRFLYENWEITNPDIATGIHRLARDILNRQELYKEEKYEANELLLGTYDVWKEMVMESDNPFFTAAKLAVIGNVLDYGAHSIESDIVNQINTLSRKKLAIDETDTLFEKINSAGSILYLGDNAGEIVFDRLFIETFGASDVTYVVRGKPVINDVTMEDAIQCGIDKICRTISNGFDAPSTLPEYCSDEFLKIYNQADLIIAKGQGNFEGLMNSDHNNLFFLLMAKCNPMAELIGVDVGDMIVWSNNR
ncbi:MAG: DUF89 family protein [Bacteroidales bacterium]|nr:DUF89 family protein [Bacteroidales bacterium]